MIVATTKRSHHEQREQSMKGFSYCSKNISVIIRLRMVLGLSKDETIDVVTKRGWTCLNQNEIIKPIKNKKEAKYALQNEEHLEKLTRHILYLET